MVQLAPYCTNHLNKEFLRKYSQTTKGENPLLPFLVSFFVLPTSSSVDSFMYYVLQNPITTGYWAPFWAHLITKNFPFPLQLSNLLQYKRIYYWSCLCRTTFGITEKGFNSYFFHILLLLRIPICFYKKYSFLLESNCWIEPSKSFPSTVNV